MINSNLKKIVMAMSGIIMISNTATASGHRQHRNMPPVTSDPVVTQPMAQQNAPQRHRRTHAIPQVNPRAEQAAEVQRLQRELAMQQAQEKVANAQNSMAANKQNTAQRTNPNFNKRLAAMRFAADKQALNDQARTLNNNKGRGLIKFAVDQNGMLVDQYGYFVDQTGEIIGGYINDSMRGTSIEATEDIRRELGLFDDEYEYEEDEEEEFNRFPTQSNEFNEINNINYQDFPELPQQQIDTINDTNSEISVKTNDIVEEEAENETPINSQNNSDTDFSNKIENDINFNEEEDLNKSQIKSDKFTDSSDTNEKSFSISENNNFEEDFNEQSPRLMPKQQSENDNIENLETSNQQEIINDDFDNEKQISAKTSGSNDEKVEQINVQNQQERLDNNDANFDNENQPNNQKQQDQTNNDENIDLGDI